MSKIDLQAILCGKNGLGKTSLLRELVAEHLKRGNLVFVHDTNREFEGLPAFPTVAHYYAANRKLSQEAGRPRMLQAAAIHDMDHESITQLVLDISKRCDGLPEDRRPSIVLCYDEVTRLKGLHPSYIPPKMDDLQSNRRHYHVGLIFLSQRVGQMQEGLREQCTDFYMFKTPSRKRRRQTADVFGFEHSHMDAAQQLLPEKWAYLHIKDGAFVGT